MSARHCCTGNCRQGRACIAPRRAVAPFWENAIAAVAGAFLIAAPFIIRLG